MNYASWKCSGTADGAVNAILLEKLTDGCRNMRLFNSRRQAMIDANGGPNLSQHWMSAGTTTPPCLLLRADTWLTPLDGLAKRHGGSGGSTVSLCTNGAFVRLPRISRGRGYDRHGGARRRRSGWGSRHSERPTARVHPTRTFDRKSQVFCLGIPGRLGYRAKPTSMERCTWDSVQRRPGPCGST